MNTNTITKTASSSRTGRTNSSKTTLVKGPKPLLKFKFYLDVKNHCVCSKLEAKIKSLGGVIEVFLVEEVTHVITDRELCSVGVNSPQLRSVESQGSNESPQGTVSGGSLRQKTRADAMLEKVRAQATNKPSDPLHSAKQWNIPIWTVHRVLSWLDKVTASLATAKSRRVKLISIKAPFLKFEPVLRDGRPVYKSLQTWPQIDLEAGSCKPAFLIKNTAVANISEGGEQQNHELDATNDGRMTRKQRTRLSVRNGNKETEVDKQALVGGFCEICHCEYREIGEHVRSEQHLNFVKNDANFLELDTLISAGANVEAFLRLNGNTGKDLNNYPLFGRRSLRKLNGKNTPEKYNGSGPVKRNKMPRTSSNHSPLSTTESESGHHLRSRGQLWLPPNLLGTTAEDEPYSNKAKDNKLERKSSCRLSEDDTKNTKENAHSSENTRPKRTCPKTKRISADERLVADNKTYYKVEVMTTKLRSSGLGNREHELARRVQTPIPEEEPEDSDEGLVVKFKRVRRSELSVLNDEAENFMFPRKDDTGLSDIDSDEAPNTTRSSIRSDTSEIKSSEVDFKLLRQESVVDRLDDCTNASSDAAPRRRTRNGTRLDVPECEEEPGSVETENTSARRRRTRADTKCEQEENDVDSCKRRTRNDTKSDPLDLEDTNSGDNYDNSRKRRTRNDTKAELEDSDDHSEPEIFPKRLKRTASKEEQDLDDPTANSTGESRKRRRAKSETPDVDDHEMELRRKRRKVYTELEEEAARDENCATEDNMPRKKRRTQAEAFIADNRRYYRFETPGSRLRYQGAQATNKPDTAEKPACESGDEQVVQVDHDQLVRLPRDNLKFSFELLPKSEPWYCTFQRQDKGEEFYTCVSDPGYSHRFYLPYQFSYLMPLDPKVCIEEYKQKRESYIKSEAAKLDVAVDSPLQSLDSPAPSESVTEKSNESDKPLSEIQIMKRRRKRRFYANHPRKSPRQHASTLAILSSLIQQRKKRARKSDSSRASLASIPEEVTPQPLVMDESSQCLSESGLDPALEAILTAPMDDLSDLEYHDVDGIVINDKPDAIELLTNYNTAVPMSSPESRTTAPRTESVRVVRRKRKKNRTGWPKKKRLFVKRSELKCDSSVLELEDTRLSVEEPGEVDATACTEPRTVNEKCAEGETNTCSSISGEERRLSGIESATPTNTDPSNNELASRDNNNSVYSDILTVKVKQEHDEPLIVITNTALADLHVKQEDLSVKTEVPEDLDTADGGYQKLSVIVPCRKSQRNSSSDCSVAEEVIASQTDKLSACVHVALDKWENAEKVLHAKMSENETVPNEKLLQYQPFVRVQKIDNSTLALQNANRRLRSSSSPERKPKSKRARTLTASPRTPRKLRAPRGKWYRER
ncbi:chiffon [Carabus blaptoides fortunei]